MLCEFIMLRCVPNDQTIIDNLEHASCRLILFSNGVSDVASANFGALSPHAGGRLLPQLRGIDPGPLVSEPMSHLASREEVRRIGLAGYPF